MLRTVIKRIDATIKTEGWSYNGSMFTIGKVGNLCAATVLCAPAATDFTQ